MTIERLPFERRPRNSIANNLDRINELVDWVNQDTHLCTSASGERVTVYDTSSLKGLEVNGKSVQNGTPTPDAPVPVQVVQGRNLLPKASNRTVSGVTFTVQQDGSVLVDGTATANIDFVINNFVREDLTRDSYFLSGCPSGGSYNTYYLRALRPSPWKVYVTDGGNGAVLNMGTVETGATVRIVIGISSGTVCDNLLFRPQLEAGSTATPYVSYGSIGIVVGDTATSIDLQGNVLASLPDGTRDELHVDSAGHVWIEKRVGYVSADTLSSHVAAADVFTDFVRIRCARALADNPAPYNTPALMRNGYCNVAPFTGAGYNSDTLHAYAHLLDFYLFAPVGDKSTWDATTAAEWVTEHGAYAYYTPAATTTIDLGYIAPPAIPSGSVVTVSASLTTTFSLEWWVDSGITDMIEDLKAYVDYRIGE